MPEGPTIINIKERLSFLKGKTITHADGYAPMEKVFLLNKKILDVMTFGKYLIIKVKGYFVTIHLGMFGSILLNERLKVNASFGFIAGKDAINGYMVKVKKYEGEPESFYDWRTDIMSEAYDLKYVHSLLQGKYAKDKIEDTLMNQAVFTGVGNIIKNEVLYRCKVHPESRNSAIPAEKLKTIIKDCQAYGTIFLKRLYSHTVHKETEIYQKEFCPKHKTPLKIYISGKAKRKNFDCEKCQQLYNLPELNFDYK